MLGLFGSRGTRFAPASLRSNSRAKSVNEGAARLPKSPALLADSYGTGKAKE
jgi:hypothetical protein